MVLYMVFLRTIASTCVSYHSEKVIDLIVHGDAWVTVGDLGERLLPSGVFECTLDWSSSLGQNDDKAAEVTNRMIMHVTLVHQNFTPQERKFCVISVVR